MRFIIILIISFFLFINNTIANEEDEDQIYFLKKVSSTFWEQCFLYKSVLEKEKLEWNLENGIYKSYKISINSDKNLSIIQNDKLLPYKKIDEENNFISYKSDFLNNIDDINDDNTNTFIEIDTEDTEEFIIELDKKLIKDSYVFNSDIDSKYRILTYNISEDWLNYSQVTKSNINNFDTKYLKIEFKCKNTTNCIRENIKIKEINFKENRKILVLKSFYEEDIKFYTNYNCKDKSYLEYAKYYDDFNIDINTNKIEVDLYKNINYNTSLKIDSDWDSIFDEADNCPFVYNPNQEDTWTTWTWDLCSDKDKDYIDWNLDNCPTLYNPKQIDEDWNWIWDLCEQDMDDDWVYDIIDNCINNYNPNQEDKDSDGVWNICDNCIEKYNKNQEDTDKDWLWNTCDETDDRFLEKNKIVFISLIVTVSIIFLVGIYIMIRKINKI